jgi:hypothetical protein
VPYVVAEFVFNTKMMMKTMIMLSFDPCKSARMMHGKWTVGFRILRNDLSSEAWAGGRHQLTHPSPQFGPCTSRRRAPLQRGNASPKFTT